MLEVRHFNFRLCIQPNSRGYGGLVIYRGVWITKLPYSVSRRPQFSIPIRIPAPILYTAYEAKFIKDKKQKTIVYNKVPVWVGTTLVIFSITQSVSRV